MVSKMSKPTTENNLWLRLAKKIMESLEPKRRIKKNKFKVGDAVYLKSGSPSMFITKVHTKPNSYTCLWVRTNGEACRSQFNEKCLTTKPRKESK